MVSSVDRIQWQALADQARSFTYCLTDQQDGPIGTAIAIRLATRFFFATARHVIENRHGVEIVPRGKIENAVSQFAARHCSEQLDIGLLELTADHARYFDFADNSRLCTTIDTDRDLPALVVGCPSQLIHSAKTWLNSQTRLCLCGCADFTYRSVVLPQSQWPDNDSVLPPLVPGRDLLVDFQHDGRMTLLPPGVLLPEASSVNCDTVDPRGLSGGGIWLAQVEDRNGLWISDIRLIGIQTGWYEQKGWLRGVRIEQWLNMVHTKYPHLAEGI
jgi:hypothetical protein